MLYDYQYDVVSLIVISFLLITYLIRRTYKTRANQLLLVLMLFILFTASFDILSCFTISYPWRYPLWFDYVGAYGYLLLYNWSSVIFFVYCDSKTKIDVIRKPVKVVAGICLVLQTVLIVSSPWTHWVSYFDENNVYQHGIAMQVLYVVALLLLICTIFMFIVARRRFNMYQILAVCEFVFAILVSVIIQGIFPRLLVGNFACALVLFFIYTALENPIYYTYKDTRCYNRKTFLETIKKKSRMANPKDRRMSVLGFIVDDYAQIRHKISLKNLERLSSSIAEYLYNCFRTCAYCLDDDRFVIILDDISYEEAKAKLDEFFSITMQLVSANLNVSVSTVYIDDIEVTKEIDDIENSINYLLENTEGGHKDVTDFQEVMAKSRRKYAISRKLSKAIVYDGFDVYYQPIRNMKSGKFTSVEALIRMNDDEFGFISPEEFIPIAEQEGKICEIGEIVFRKVCRFINTSGCMDLGLEYIEINLSPIQCFQEDLVQVFDRIMKENDINPAWINLEITETASFEANNLMAQNIDKLNKLGICFSLDDYGSGFASADYLFRLPVQIVKIDKCILWQAIKDSNAMIVLEHTVNMLKRLNKKIVVEGVEDKNMLEVLDNMGCDFVQGFYYSKAITGDTCIEFLRDNNK